MKFSEFLAELRMNPSSIKAFAEKSNLRVGFELEVLFTDLQAFGAQARKIPNDITLTGLWDFLEISPYESSALKLERKFKSWCREMASVELDDNHGIYIDDFVRDERIEVDGMVGDDEYYEDLDKLLDEKWFKDELRDYIEAKMENRGELSLYRFFQDELELTTYEAIAHEFNFDLPEDEDDVVMHRGERTDDPWVIRTTKIARKFEHDLGVNECDINDDHNQNEKDSDRWTLEPDGSIKGGVHGVEFVSPVYSSISEGIKQLTQVFEWLKNHGAESNSSCGLHINISGTKHAQLDVVKLVLFLGDVHLLKEFGREANAFCESMLNNIKNALNSDSAFVEKQMKLMQSGLTDVAAHQLKARRDLGKYVSINLKSNRVEFRSVGNNYLSEGEKVLNAVGRCAQAYDVACNSEAYKEEYYKKYYKLIAANRRGDDSFEKIMDLFARYAAGNFDSWNTKDMIKKKIAKFQAQRKSGEKPDPGTF